MTGPNAISAQVSNGEVREIFGGIANGLGFENKPEIISWGPPGWAASAGTDNSETGVAIKLVHTTEPEQLLDETYKQIDVVEQLRAHGGRVLEFLDEPWIEQGRKDTPGAFVATSSRYLPGKDVTDYEYGGALASLHDASRYVDVRALEHMDPFLCITNVQEAVEHVEDLRAKGKAFQIGNIAMSGAQVDLFAQTVADANRYREQLYASATNKNSPPLVVVQEDVYQANARRANNGEPTLLDIEPLVGPAAVDFGRATNDLIRFGDSDNWNPEDFKQGYIDTISSGQLPPPAELDLAAEYSERRTPAMLTALAINAVRNGHPGEEWLLGEGLYRLSAIGQRDKLWHPHGDAQKALMRADRD